MQNEPTPPEGKNSAQTEAESALRGAACCASFTPGPWKADGYHVRQSGQHGTRMITDVCYTGHHHTPPDEYPKSCRLADEANARLIAAAPQLLDACLRFVNLPGDYNLLMDAEYVFADAKKAIKAAIVDSLHNAQGHQSQPRASVAAKKDSE